MAQIYRRVKGQKITKVIALHRTVQDRLDRIALERGVRAEAILRSHENTGASTIHVERGDVDRYVVLDDERGQAAAMSIEYGRDFYSPHGLGVITHSEPTWTLHDAFDLPHRG